MRLGLFIAPAIAVLAALGMVLLAFADPLAVARGWAVAFVWSSMAPVGAVALLLIHRISGGEWGSALAPLLVPAAKAIALVVLASVPVLLFSGRIYDWASPEMPAAVSRFYMTAPFFALRTIIALSFWSLFAWLPSLRATVPGAGVGLIGLGIITNVIPVDWVVSSQPGFHSSDFGFEFLIEQILAALALAALLGPQGEDPRECRDLAGLIISCILGWVYFAYVEFAIIWYGDLPEEAGWYAVRGREPWRAIGNGALLLGAVLPFCVLLSNQARASEAVLRGIGAAVLLGISLHIVWLMAPSFGVQALLPAVLGIVLLGALFTSFLQRTGLSWAAQRTDAAAHHG
jgi:hypothetical protein